MRFNDESSALDAVESPAYVLNASLMRKNLELIDTVRRASGAKILVAFKAFSLWSAFDIMRPLFSEATVSSPNEVILAKKHLGGRSHAFSPAYTDKDFDIYLQNCSHITFNSLSQYEHFRTRVLTADHKISMGIRINPMFSPVDTDLYNPCCPGSRLGVTADLLPRTLPDEIEGIHFHALCESSADDLENLISVVESRYENWLGQVKWVNMGGGHLMTKKGYDINKLVSLLQNFAKKWGLQVILEPGSAFAWQTGPLVADIVDIVNNANIKTAILNVSFAAHIPDVL